MDPAGSPTRLASAELIGPVLHLMRDVIFCGLITSRREDVESPGWLRNKNAIASRNSSLTCKCLDSRQATAFMHMQETPLRGLRWLGVFLIHEPCSWHIGAMRLTSKGDVLKIRSRTAFALRQIACSASVTFASTALQLGVSFFRSSRQCGMISLVVNFRLHALGSGGNH